MSHEVLKALHLISVMCWIAGMFFLPRLFVFHVGAKEGGDLSETLKIMERRLLKLFINPAMAASFIFGVWLIMQNPGLLKMPFMHVKFLGIAVLLGTHVVLSRCRRAFFEDRNRKSEKFFRILKVVPVLCAILIVGMVIIRPW